MTTSSCVRVHRSHRAWGSRIARSPVPVSAADLLHGMLIGAVVLLLALPLQFWKVKWSLVGNCVLVALGSLCSYIGLLPDTPSLAWLVLGRVLTIVGGEAGFILLMIQANLVWGQWTPFAIGVGFVAGFATVVQFMAHLSTWLVDESGPANGLGLFMVVMSFAAVAASVRVVPAWLFTVVSMTSWWLYVRVSRLLPPRPCL